MCQLGLEAVTVDLGAWDDQTKAWYGVEANAYTLAYTLAVGPRQVNFNLPPKMEHDSCTDVYPML